MGSHKSRSVGLVAVVLIAIVTVVAGGAAGLWIGLSQTPDGLAAPPQAKVFPVSTSPFDDSHQVKLDLSTEPGLTLVAHTTGVITAAGCEPGGSIASGSVPWRIDGAPVLALATATPFHRGFKKGTNGADVAGLQKELARLGLDVTKTGTFDGRTGKAVVKLLAKAGIDTSSGQDATLPLAELVWLPATTVTTTSCEVLMGGPVADGAPLAVTAPSVTGIAVSPMPSNLVPGNRTVTLGGVTVPVGKDGKISDTKAIDKVLATGAGKAAVATAGTDHPQSLSGTLALAQPIQAATVPATAVAGNAGTTCVLDPGGTKHAVTVVDSSLGRSVVEFAGTPPGTVRIAAGGGVSCGS